MSDNTHIQWTDATWSVTTGCTKVSDGCVNCYIERTPPFRMERRRFDKPGIGGSTDVRLHPERLDWPLKWRKPRRIFVDSLADLFHTEVPDEFIAKTFAVMVAAPQHTYQVLTKRHDRLASLLNSPAFWGAVSAELCQLWRTDRVAPLSAVPSWIWVGVSVESQKWADVRIPALLKVPAHVRWLSCEPLLGPVSLRGWIERVPVADGGYPSYIDWVVCGGESGPGSRPFDPQWARDLVEQCRAAGVAPFVKQLGSVWARENGAADRKGGDWGEWPADLRVREYPQPRALAVTS